MLTIYQFKPAWGLLNASPFCMKLEVYLKLAKIPYECHYTYKTNASPTRKLPYIKIGEQILSDSTLIIEYLKTQYGDTLDASLTENQRAEAWALQVLLEEHLYWIIVYSRWIDKAGWQLLKNEFFGSLPKLAQMIVPSLLRKKIKHTLDAQGLGRHTPETIYNLGKKDLSAIATFLATQAFMFGEKPTSLDACVYAFLSAILYTPINSPLKQHLEQLPELRAYSERVKQLLNS